MTTGCWTGYVGNDVLVRCGSRRNGYGVGYGVLKAAGGPHTARGMSTKRHMIRTHQTYTPLRAGFQNDPITCALERATRDVIVLLC